MYKVTLRYYGSNGATGLQKIVFDVDTEAEIMKAMREVVEGESADGTPIMEYTEHPKIKSATELPNRVLDAGGLACEFVSLHKDKKLIEPSQELIKFFE